MYHILDFSFFMSQDDAYFHIHQNDPAIENLKVETSLDVQSKIQFGLKLSVIDVNV